MPLIKKSLILFTVPLEMRGMPCHACHAMQGLKEKHYVWSEGRRGMPRPEPSLAFPCRRQGRAGKQLRIDWFEEFQHAWGLDTIPLVWYLALGDLKQGEYWRGM